MIKKKHPVDRTVVMLDRIREVFATDAEAARALGLPDGAPAEWRRGRQPSDPEWDRFVDLFAVVEKLEGYYTAPRIRLWWVGKNAHLGGRSPLYLIRNGDTGAVFAAIHATKASAFA